MKKSEKRYLRKRRQISKIIMSVKVVYEIGVKMFIQKIIQASQMLLLQPKRYFLKWDSTNQVL